MKSNLRASILKQLSSEKDRYESFVELIKILAHENVEGKITLMKCLIIKEIFEIGMETIGNGT